MYEWKRRAWSMILSFKDFIAGWCAGVCGLLVGHPADTIKVRQQVFDEGKIRKLFHTLYRTEGVVGLYRGMYFPLMMAGLQKSLFFGVYGNVLMHLEGEDAINIRTCKAQQDSILGLRKDWHKHVYISGATAGIFHAFLSCPVDLIKVRIQANRLSKGEDRHRVQKVVREVIQKHGLRGIFRGLAATLARDVPTGGVYILLYEHLLSKSTCYSGSYSVKSHMLAGGTAGTITWMLATPMDVVKSRIQADNLSRPKYNGVIDCMVKSYKELGPMVFARGVRLSLLRGFPVNAAAFVGYEAVRKLIG